MAGKAGAAVSRVLAVEPRVQGADRFFVVGAEFFLKPSGPLDPRLAAVKHDRPRKLAMSEAEDVADLMDSDGCKVVLTALDRVQTPSGIWIEKDIAFEQVALAIGAWGGKGQGLAGSEEGPFLGGGEVEGDILLCRRWEGLDLAFVETFEGGTSRSRPRCESLLCFGFVSGLTVGLEGSRPLIGEEVPRQGLGGGGPDVRLATDTGIELGTLGDGRVGASAIGGLGITARARTSGISDRRTAGTARLGTASSCDQGIPGVCGVCGEAHKKGDGEAPRPEA